MSILFLFGVIKDDCFGASMRSPHINWYRALEKKLGVPHINEYDDKSSFLYQFRLTKTKGGGGESRNRQREREREREREK